jgi:ribonuclease D
MSTTHIDYEVCLNVSSRTSRDYRKVKITVTNDAAAMSRWLAEHAAVSVGGGGGSGASGSGGGGGASAGSASASAGGGSASASASASAGGGASRSSLRLGFDTESRPVFTKGVKSHVSIVQLATSNAILVAHIGEKCVGHPIAVRTLLLETPGLSLVGMAARNDVTELAEALGATTRPSCGVIDLKDSSTQRGCNVSGGLDGLARSLLDVSKWKSKSLQLARWDNWPLKQKEVIYAAMDAWMGLQCLLHMEENHPIKVPPPLSGTLRAFFPPTTGSEDVTQEPRTKIPKLEAEY